MCNVCKNNTRQTLEGLSVELTFLMSELRLIENIITEVFAKSNLDLQSQHIFGLQKFDQVIQTIEALANYATNLSKTDISNYELQKAIKQIHLESVRNRMGAYFGANKSNEIDISDNSVEFF